jgi:hypothetical protein
LLDLPNNTALCWKWEHAAMDKKKGGIKWWLGFLEWLLTLPATPLVEYTPSQFPNRITRAEPMHISVTFCVIQLSLSLAPFPSFFS